MIVIWYEGYTYSIHIYRLDVTVISIILIVPQGPLRRSAGEGGGGDANAIAGRVVLASKLEVLGHVFKLHATCSL